MINMVISKKTKLTNLPQLPFILSFLEYRKGAMSGTTSGTYDDIDCADTD